MAYTQLAPLLGATPVTSNGTGPALNLGTLRGNGLPAAAALEQRYTAAAFTGSGSVALAYDTSDDGATWAAIAPTATPAAISSSSATGTVRLFGLHQFVRVRWTVTGTVSCTLALAGVSKIIYAGLDDATLAIPPNALAAIDTDTQSRLLEAASGEADAAIRMQNLLPLKDWGPELTQKVVDIFVLLALKRRGMNPEDPANQLIVDAAREARRWLQLLGAGDIDAGLVDSSATGAEGGAIVVTSSRRGWDMFNG